MKDLKDRVAVVTGGASGIGRAMADSFLGEGMHVVLADIDAEILLKTRQELRTDQAEVFACVTDVSKPEDVQRLARETIDRFGRVDVLCNNAGVGVGGVPTWESTLDDWQWILGVNLMGVIHGIRTFTPIMLAQETQGWIVNTASMAGVTIAGGNALYGVTKHAVVALTESLHNEFKSRGTKLRAVLLCPGFVSTDIMNAPRHRPESLPDAALPKKVSPMEARFFEAFCEQIEKGMDPGVVGDMVLTAIKEKRFYVLTHPHWKPMIEKRMRNLLDEGEPDPLHPPEFDEFFASLFTEE